VRICLLTRFFDFRNAGLGRVSLELRNGLIKKGHSVRTVSTNRDSLYSYFWYTLAEVPLKLGSVEADVYHAVTPMEGMWLPRNKSIVTFHDLFQITNPRQLGSGLGRSRWKNLIGRSYFKFAVNLAKRCSRIVAVSEKTKEDLVNYLNVPEGKIKVIRSGIRHDLVPMPKRDKVFRVGYLGQLDRRKRVDVLIEAFKRSDLDELVIGGTGADEDILSRMACKDRRIKFLGFVPDRGLADFYNSLSVFVFPTWLEGYGLPIAEAMACGKPVIVLDDADIPWEVKRRCIIVEDLGYALGNRDYLEGLCRSVNISSNCEWAKSHSWDKTVDEHIRLYKEVLSA